MELAEVKGNIKRLRELKGFTQGQIAEKLSMKLRNYQDIENEADRDFSFLQLQKIAKVLEMSVASLVGFDERIIFNNCTNGNESPSSFHYKVETPEKLYEKLVTEKDKRIEFLEKRLEREEKQNDMLQALLSKLG